MYIFIFEHYTHYNLIRVYVFMVFPEYPEKMNPVTPTGSSLHPNNISAKTLTSHLNPYQSSIEPN